LIEQRLKKMEVPAIDELDFHRSVLQFLRRNQSTESSAQYDDPMFLAHARQSPKRNPPEAVIISRIMDCRDLMPTGAAAIRGSVATFRE
jgi:hypothetical protein